MDEHLRKTLSNVGKVELNIISRLGGARNGENVTIQLEGLYQDNRDLIDQFIGGAGNDLELEMAIGDREDIKFLDALATEGIIDCIYSYAESKAKVKLKGSKKLREVREWVEIVKPNLIEYGLVALDIARGDVYYLDKKRTLIPYKGPYNVLKHLISNQAHEISAGEIASFQTKKQDDSGAREPSTESETATQAIYDLKKALGWTEDLADLIELRANKMYHLLPFLPGK